MRAIRRGASTLLTGSLLAVGLLVTPANAVAPVDPPVLTSPIEGETVFANPVLAWEPVAGAAKYRVQISTSPSFPATVYNTITYGLHATPPTDLPVGALFWRVQGIDAAAAGGPFAVGSFIKSPSVAPTLIDPIDNDTLTFPTEPVVLRWDALPGAKSYRVQVDDANDFIGAQTFTTSSTTLALTDLQPTDQWFYWHVQAVSPANINSEFSPTWRYQVSWPIAPTLIRPADGAKITDAVFEWSPIKGAASYDIEVSPNGDWANNITFREVVKGTIYAPPATIDNGSYYWRVRGRDARLSGANVGPWSVVRQFDRAWDAPTDRVTALAMATDENGNVSTPTFRWSAARHASHYELQVSIDVNFSPSPTNPMQCFTNHTSFTPYARIQGVGPSNPAPAGSKCDVAVVDGETYYWRVRPLDGPTITGVGDAVNGAWSNTVSFTSRRAIPVMTTPRGGDPLVLRWTAVRDIEAYEVVIVKGNGSTVKVTTHALSYSPTKLLRPEDGPFSWYVHTVDHTGVKGSIPLTFPSFELPTVGPFTPTPEPIGTQGLSSRRARSLQWTPVSTATYYKVFSVEGGSYTPFDDGDKVPFPSFTPTQVLAPGTYGWAVGAYNDADLLISLTDVNGSFTIAETDLGTPISPCSPQVACELADTPTLRWESASNNGERVGYYIVYVAVDPLFTNILREYHTKYTSLTPRESYLDNQAGQSYYWFVRPCVAPGACGRFNEDVYGHAYRFRKKSPAIVARTPAHGAVKADLVRFTWDDYLQTNEPAGVAQEARQYRIQVSTASDFSTLLDEQVVDQTEYTPFDLTYPEGPLYWRVQAIDGSRNALTWNDKVNGSERLVTKQSAPTQLHPSMFSPAPQPATPSLRWLPDFYAGSYQVEVYKNGDINYSLVNRVLTQTTKLAAWTPSTALPSGSYAWRVRRLDADSRPGTWSSDLPGQAVTFQIEADDAALLNPAPGAVLTTDDIVFTWGNVAGAVQYRIDVSQSPSFSPITESVTTVMNSWAAVKKYADGTYWWRVSVIGGAGTVLSTSAARSFVKDSSPPTVLTVTPVSGVPLAGPITVTFSEPVTDVSAASLVVRIAGTATAVPGSVSQPSTTTGQFVPTSPLTPGESYAVSLTSAIKDLHGNALVPATRTVRADTVVENNSPAIRERWDGEKSSAASGGYYEGTQTKGARSTFTFTGTGVAVYGMRSAIGGYADVYLDGVKQASPISCYRAGTATPVRALLWSRTGLPPGAHTLIVVARGTHPRGSKGNWLWVDNYKVGATIFQESSAAVRETFGRVNTGLAYGDSYHVESARDSDYRPSYSMTFKGTRIAWYATKLPSGGTARVYIDGVLVRTVNLYAGSPAYRALVFSSASLANSKHTIKIVLMTARDARSSGRRVSLDRLRVT